MKIESISLIVFDLQWAKEGDIKFNWMG